MTTNDAFSWLCPTCGHRKSYDEKYDAYYCPMCKKWLEKKCSDSECHFCVNRPKNPPKGKSE